MNELTSMMHKVLGEVDNKDASEEAQVKMLLGEIQMEAKIHSEGFLLAMKTYKKWLP